jgi:FtsP/CotA-like multicopper oxidase with cupredoxin domain
MRVRTTIASLVVVLLATSVAAKRPPKELRVRTDDNLHPAGSLKNGILQLSLDTRNAVWYPEGDKGQSVEVPAFAEKGHAPQIPGPLIRVPAGTEVVVSVTNSVPDAELIVHGLSSRTATTPATPATPDSGLRVPAGGTREARFRLEAPGTYYYWGTTTGKAFLRRAGLDAQLSGVIVVDPAGVKPPRDRIMVIGMWADSVPTESARGIGFARMLLTINGRSWPSTTRLTYTAGDTVRWRVVNASADVHPMHLHGFYFNVEGRGNGMIDSSYDAAHRDMEVTERLRPGRTMNISWVAERPGNWLFHCHLTAHFMARGPLGMRLSDSAAMAADMHAHNHALDAMTGLVVGVTVAPGRTRTVANATSDANRRRMRLVVRDGDGGSTMSPVLALALQTGDAELPPDTARRAGPPIVLVRDEPVVITVVNGSSHTTAVHWHGIELDSYFDGVAGFSGDAKRISPAIAPGDSFAARFTPPRAGTFIYHTHIDEMRQEPAGMAGPLIVLEKGQQFDPATDVPVLVSSPRDKEVESHAVLLNGSLAPAPIEVRAGVPYRVRLINITVARPGMRFELRQDTTLLAWRMIAKDGADVPVARRAPQLARQTISIGETYDFEFTPAAAGELRLEAQTGTGVKLGVLPVHVVQ